MAGVDDMNDSIFPPVKSGRETKNIWDSLPPWTGPSLHEDGTGLMAFLLISTTFLGQECTGLRRGNGKLPGVSGGDFQWVVP